MTERIWRKAAAIGCVAGALAVSAGIAQAQGYGPPTVVADDCDDDGCCNWCRGLSFCNKLRMHSAYCSRMICRPYRQVGYIPPEVAPYIGPGTWSSPGYGLPYAGPQGAPYGYAPAAPMGNAR